MTGAPEPRTVGFQPGERNVFFHLLTACNLRCRHCYINPAEHGTTTLPLATVQRWLKLFARPERETTSSSWAASPPCTRTWRPSSARPSPCATRSPWTPTATCSTTSWTGSARRNSIT